MKSCLRPTQAALTGPEILITRANGVRVADILSQVLSTAGAEGWWKPG